jgi:serine/threonine-protein kinase
LRRLVNGSNSGQVWEAEQLGLGGRVAIKFLPTCHLEDDAARARFEREARAISEVRSPYFVRVQDHGVHADIPYLVMELLEGETLATLLERERQLPLQDTAEIIGQLSQALDEAHGAGVVHRDVRPENIFVMREADGSRFIRLLDFGIVKRLSDQSLTLSHDGAVVGSPHYSSPEEISQPSAVDARTDTWAVGVTAYRMLVGRVPFTTDAQGDPSALFSAILDGRYTPATLARTELPAALDDWFSHMLAVTPEERFDTLQAASAALSALSQAHRSERARLTTLPLPEVARARRSRQLWASGAACVALLVAAIAYKLLQPSHGPSSSQAKPRAREAAKAEVPTAPPALQPTQTVVEAAQAEPRPSLQPSATELQPSPGDAAMTTPVESPRERGPAETAAHPAATRHDAPLTRARNTVRPRQARPDAAPTAPASPAPTHAREPQSPPLPKDRGF